MIKQQYDNCFMKDGYYLTTDLQLPGNFLMTACQLCLPNILKQFIFFLENFIEHIESLD